MNSLNFHISFSMNHRLTKTKGSTCKIQIFESVSTRTNLERRYKGLRKPEWTVKQNLELGRAFPFTQEGQDKYD